MSDERHLETLRSRLWANTDEARPDAVARRRKTNQRTARENIADLVMRAFSRIRRARASVIDPADTRAWLVRGLSAVGPIERRRRFIDTW